MQYLRRQRVRRPAHTRWVSFVGQKALLHCLTLFNATVIDKIVKEMCTACVEGPPKFSQGQEGELTQQQIVIHHGHKFSYWLGIVVFT